MATRKSIKASAPPAPTERAASLTDQIHDVLKQEIIKGVWRPGQIVLEPSLAERHQVSKTPVREALRLLAQEDWIDILPRKGYLVRPLRLGDIGEIFKLRLMIEPTLVADAARVTGDSAVTQLSGHLADQRHGDLQLSLDAARRFHLASAQISRNHRAEVILERLLDEVRRLHYLMPDVESHITSTVEVDAHEQLMHALDKHDPDAAAELMRTHLAEVARTMTEAFTSVRID